MSIKRAEADRAQLIERRAVLEREIAHLDGEIARIDTYIDLARRYDGIPRPRASTRRAAVVVATDNDVPPAVSPSPASSPPVAAERQIDERFRQKSFPEAAYLALEIEGRAMSTPEITKALIGAGIPFSAKSPETSVYTALKAIERVGRVRRPGRGLWEVVPEGERQNVIPSYPDQVKPEDHSDRTRLGLALAKERGVQLGARERLTEEQQELAIGMLKEGKTVDETAQSVGMSRSGFVKWMIRHNVRRHVPRATVD